MIEKGAIDLFKDKVKWCSYYFKTQYEKFLIKTGHRDKIVHKYNKPSINMEESHKLIYDWICQGEPRMIARYGGCESRATTMALGVNLGVRRKIDKKTLHTIHTLAGLYPYGQETVCKFGTLMAELSKEVDLLGSWPVIMQDYLINNILNPEATLTELGNLEPYYNLENPWSRALKGKKVLVVHPFEETIQSQYAKRELLFPEYEDLLPEFELKTLKAVQSIGGEGDSEKYKDWFEALDYMYQEALKIDFDVAILGCGAYGFPLAAKLKQAGKVAIHLGGSTQLLFGIKGKRWDDSEVVSKFYNEHWVRPSSKETPKSAGKVEGGCYW